MKITKIKTTLGQFGSPITSDLSDIVERMRSPKTKEVADRIAAIALQSRLAMQQGAPRYMLNDANRLPYLMFSATFGSRSLNKPAALTGLLMLNIPCPQGTQQISELRRRVSQIPYTVLAFAGVSGITLKVVVRCDCPNPAPADVNEYLSYLRDAHENAARLYTTLAMCDLLVEEQRLTRGCRMSYDPQLYYNPEAQPMPVVREARNPLTVYEGTKADDEGTVVWFPDDAARERIEMEFHTCLSKAIDDCGDQAEQCLQTLADYCHKACLQEEGCVVRTLWCARFKTLDANLVRKVFRNVYKKPYNGKPVSQMNEKERIMRSIEDFLSRRYELRFNTVKQMTEFRPNDLRFKQWRPLTERELKSIVVEEMKEGGESWINDIRTYVESAHVQDYNPIHEFLAGCGKWDGKANYIEDFARRLKTDYKDWPKYFHRWFLAMVAQALNVNRDYGNSMVPLLIGEQGYLKTQFCNHILPPSMREYYMKDIKMDNAEQVERVLGRMGACAGPHVAGEHRRVRLEDAARAGENQAAAHREGRAGAPHAQRPVHHDPAPMLFHSHHQRPDAAALGRRHPPLPLHRGDGQGGHGRTDTLQANVRAGRDRAGRPRLHLLVHRRRRTAHSAAQPPVSAGVGTRTGAHAAFPASQAAQEGVLLDGYRHPARARQAPEGCRRAQFCQSR